ncbi:MAG: peptidoglycan DD-metalloendopeptidase family protein [Anaerolineae bacterium]
MIPIRRLIIGGLVVAVASVALSRAQTDCGLADRLDFPLERSVTTVVQGFGVPSVRHQGRYHTGEDWVFTTAESVGQPVRAMATGRVSFSSPTAWGRDGGVVIVEHRFSDGTTVNSVYGHLSEAGGIAFPARFSCVTVGQAIGTIAAGVRPAPHLHFEIRAHDPDTPGAGYIAASPAESGYFAPSDFILNTQTWLRPSNTFRTPVLHGVLSAPVVLDDYSLLYLDTRYQLRRALPDGRILWRSRLERPAVAVIAFQRQSWLVWADGTYQAVDVGTGALGEAWRISGLQPVGEPFSAAGWRIYPTANDTLTAVDEARREVVWRVGDVPPPVAVTVASVGGNAIIGLLTAENEVIQIAASGVILSRQALRRPAALASSGAGDLLVYTWGGLYTVDLNGRWQPFPVEAGKAGDSAALWRDERGLLAFDGQTLRSFDLTNTLQWQVDVPNVRGRVSLLRLDGRAALVSSGGQIATVSANGALCNQAQVAPQRRGFVWQTLSADGTWRLVAANHLIGFNWLRFNQNCL